MSEPDYPSFSVLRAAELRMILGAAEDAVAAARAADVELTSGTISLSAADGGFQSVIFRCDDDDEPRFVIFADEDDGPDF